MNKIGNYTKKPVTIQAIQFADDTDTINNIVELMGCKAAVFSYKDKNNPEMLIGTPEGIMTANVGDWIIKGIKGEFYPCKPDIFEATYLKVSEPTSEQVPTAIVQTKQFRKDLDAVLQRLKFASGQGDPSQGLPETETRTSRERLLAITKIQEAIMWLGMDLKDLGNPNPYPNSYNPESPVVEPTADGLKL